MSDIIGKRVEFKILERRRSTGRVKEYIETYIGNVKTVAGNTVIIEGVSGGLYSRPISDIVVLDTLGDCDSVHSAGLPGLKDQDRNEPDPYLDVHGGLD